MFKTLALGLLFPLVSFGEAWAAGLENAYSAALSGIDPSPAIAQYNRDDGGVTFSNLSGVSELLLFVPYVEPPFYVGEFVYYRHRMGEVGAWTADASLPFSDPFPVGPIIKPGTPASGVLLLYRRLSVSRFYQYAQIEAVPEPSLLAIAASSLIGLSLIRRRRR
jgi:hypothetical protein